jgi:hypothetical protein
MEMIFPSGLMIENLSILQTKPGKQKISINGAKNLSFQLNMQSTQSSG